MQFLFVLTYIAKITDFRWKNPNVGRAQKVCNKIYMFFWSSLGKV